MPSNHIESKSRQPAVAANDRSAMSLQPTRGELAQTRRIHILGLGNVGKLVAHAIRSLPNPPPITLCFHRFDLVQEWFRGERKITLTTHGVADSQHGYDIERVKPRKDHDVQDPIHHLILVTKAPNVVKALLSVKHRLTPSSTILFLQNGMGIVETVNRKVFSDPAQRPNYLVGIVSHGVKSDGSSFGAIHSGAGIISLGVLPVEDGPATDAQLPESSQYLAQCILRSPVLAATMQPPTELLQLQLEKLAVNCILNPITALVDARNGSLLFNFSLSRVMRLLISEISLVIRSLPELKGLPNVENRFSPGRLETMVVGVATKTRDNVSSMLADMRSGRKHNEVKFINGYIVQRGEELGIQCVMNYMLVHLVRGKQEIVHYEKLNEVPFEQIPGQMDL
ncbi:putative 2-dehydropantoate 2-reductase [Lineolata rhizophorae]|uniref:2-dehydropantoate 2-reductase n=1 Tax=Lineolata rhizophorae TaxID=578093 RepID=A0A6A6PA43_9PEZI|nr:putative 2-dehydropantoate 2-reductase [Lineolata rhizophorae]